MEDKTFELFTKMYTELTGKMDIMQLKIDNIEGELDNVKKVVIKMENDHGNKLDALFDGYKQNTERLDRIEAQVSKQEEFIIQRVK